jgi:hypothetical protein
VSAAGANAGGSSTTSALHAWSAVATGRPRTLRMADYSKA